MIYKMRDGKSGNCVFAVWDNKEKKMSTCGEEGVIKTYKGFLCNEHAPFSIDTKNAVCTINNKEVLVHDILSEAKIRLPGKQ